MSDEWTLISEWDGCFIQQKYLRFEYSFLLRVISTQVTFFMELFLFEDFSQTLHPIYGRFYIFIFTY
jgi:hypothetical protein